MKKCFDIISRETRKISLALALSLMAIVITVFAVDTDNDNMSDEFEIFFGLAPTNAADALLDPDGDMLINADESKILTDPFAQDTDRDGFGDMTDDNPVSRAYIQWGAPQFTAGDEYEYAHPDWLLGAYKVGGEWIYDPATTQSCWHVLVDESKGINSLNIDLDRNVLTNNLRYAIHYFDSGNASLYVDLLDTNGVSVAENIFGNLLTGSNTESAIILSIPTAHYPDAAVLQLRACHSRESGNPVLSVADGKHEGDIFVYEGLLYIDEDGDGLDADQEIQNHTSDHCIDSNGNGTNDYDECFNTGSSTNISDGGGGGDEDGNEGDDGEDDSGKNGKIIYVDLAIGNDTYSGRSPNISVKKGPKKTVRGGLSVAGTNDTIIIRTGTYNENLNIQGKDVKVFIEGKVKL